MIAPVPNSRSRISSILLESMAPAGPCRTNLRPQEWDDLWTSARDHCLTPYLHQRWLDCGFSACVPAATADRFVAARAQNTERNRRLLDALEELNAALRKKGISCLIPKGLPVAQACYSDIGLRVMYDVDLLIRSRDRMGAFETLRAAGYVPFLKEQVAGGEQILFWRPEKYVWNELSVFDPGQPLFVELHTSPWGRRWHGFRLKCSLNLWQDSRVEDVFGVSFRVPSKEKLLVYLAIHYACNVLEANARLMHLLDIVLLLRSRAGLLNWGTILHEIHHCRAVVFCCLALDLAVRVGEVPIPANVLAEIREAAPRKIAGWLETRGVDDASAMNLHQRRRALIHSLHWHAASGWAEKAGVLFHSFCSPWHEGTGLERLKLAGRRFLERARVWIDQANGRPE